MTDIINYTLNYTHIALLPVNGAREWLRNEILLIRSFFFLSGVRSLI